jgi:hypothetical protein
MKPLRLSDLAAQRSASPERDHPSQGRRGRLLAALLFYAPIPLRFLLEYGPTTPTRCGTNLHLPKVLARASLLFPFPTLPQSSGTRLAVGDVIAPAAFLRTFASVPCGFYRETRNRCRATRISRHQLAPLASSGKPLGADAVGGPVTACVIN